MKYIELQPTLQNLTNTDITFKKIAEVLGISRQTLEYRINSGKSEIPEDEIKKLENAFNVSLADHVKVDYYPGVFGSCGNGLFVLSQERKQIVVPKSAFFTRFSPLKTYSVITAQGNSMQPLFFEKDKLIVEHWDGKQIIDNKPYIFCYKDEIFIKRLAKNVDQLVIIPENRDYDIRKLEGEQLNDINIIGQIVGLMRDLR